VMDSQRAENEKRAKAAMAAFDEAGRRAAVSAKSHMLEVPVGSAPDVFAPTSPQMSWSWAATAIRVCGSSSSEALREGSWGP
jgi:hypothetical protein